MAASKPKAHRGYRLQTHNPVKRAVAAVVAVVVLMLAAAIFYWSGYRAATAMPAQERHELTDLKGQVKYLTKRNQELTDLAARLGRSGQIDKEAASRVQKSLNDLEAQLASANEELAFYRSIVSPSGDDKAVHVQRFQLKPAASKGRYSFSLVLTQMMRRRTIEAKGNIVAEIVGQQGGKARTLNLSHLTKVNMRFAFKYFQDFEGAFTLPAGFTPEKIVIKVRSDTHNLKGTQKTYSWGQALKGG